MDGKREKISCLIGGKIILEDEVLTGKALIYNDKILDIVDEKILEKKQATGELFTIDVQGRYISPGFIDLHIHGAGGRDTMDGEIADLQIISETIAQSGVTGFLATTMALERKKIFKALDVIGIAMKESRKGAQLFGAHLEGPFLSLKHKGAHQAEHIIKPDFALIEDYLDVIKIITMAPEEDAGFQFIKKVKKDTDIVLSMGHTDSDYETAKGAIALGIKSATHLFNAMPSLHHRAPGAVAAVLGSEISFELIADMIHIHPALYQLLLQGKGKEKMILVTDSMRAAYMQAGKWELGGQEVNVDANAARLADGTLAGSILKMNTALFNIMKHTNLEIFEAVALASKNPAKLLTLDEKKGSIEIGKDADLTVFDDDIDVTLTIVGGRVVFEKNQQVLK